jgi:predicted DNA-binding protein (MmcQ/YjbR family)
MTCEEYNAFCRALPAATHVVQWGGAHVWKVGGKVFAIGSPGGGPGGGEGEGQGEGAPGLAVPRITFKVSDVAYEMLKDQPGLRPAPYLASRGMKWIQHYARPGLSDSELKDYLRQSHLIVSRGLPRKTRLALGLQGR